MLFPNFQRAYSQVAAHAVAPPTMAYAMPGACSGTRNGMETSTPNAAMSSCLHVVMGGM